jgi:hypothetical protein
MIARDQNGLELEARVDEGGVLHGPHDDSYVRDHRLDDDRYVAWVDPDQPSDVVFMDRDNGVVDASSGRACAAAITHEGDESELSADAPPVSAGGIPLARRVRSRER